MSRQPTSGEVRWSLRLARDPHHRPDHRRPGRVRRQGGAAAAHTGTTLREHLSPQAGRGVPVPFSRRRGDRRRASARCPSPT
jgi:hypothetical protein